MKLAVMDIYVGLMNLRAWSVYGGNLFFFNHLNLNHGKLHIMAPSGICEYCACITWVRISVC